MRELINGIRELAKENRVELALDVNEQRVVITARRDNIKISKCQSVWEIDNCDADVAECLFENMISEMDKVGDR